MECPRCGCLTVSPVTAIAGTTFQACTECHLPEDYYSAYRKEYRNTHDCPFCDGLGRLPYTESKSLPVKWGPCLYCHLDEYQEWRKTTAPEQGLASGGAV
jgi:hypothetical protein